MYIIGSYIYWYICVLFFQLGILTSYCRANQKWQWYNILFTIVKLNIYLYTPLELERIDRSLVY